MRAMHEDEAGREDAACIDSGMPRVDVLLLNWNGWTDTTECLESLFQLEYQNFRILVCDNGSGDDSLPRLRDWADGRLRPAIADSPLPSPLRPEPSPIAWVEYDRGEAERGGDVRADDAKLVLIRVGDNLGFAGGNNLGLRFLLARRGTDPHADASYVWILNNDMVVAPDTLTRLVHEAQSDRNVGCLGATLLEYREPDVVQCVGGGRLEPWQGLPREHSATGARRGSPEGTRPDRLDFVTMGCLLAPLGVVARVGLIDDRYFIYCEDIDYSLRVKRAGLRLGYAADAEVWHKGSASMVPGSARHDYNMVRSSMLLVSKFYPHLLPAALGYSLFRCALPKVARGEWARLAAVMRGYRDFAVEVHRRRAPENGTLPAAEARAAQ